jgi:hypothetical protein
MARFATLVVAATTVLAVASPLTEAPVSAATPTQSAAVDEATFAGSMDSLSFGSSINVFVWMRAAQSPSFHDWSTDGCSTPGNVGLGDTGRSYNFRSACWRHDFSYRNSKRADSWYGVFGRYWNASSRYRIDRMFLADMRADCGPRSWTQRYSCLGWAETYYRAVRTFGGP